MVRSTTLDFAAHGSVVWEPYWPAAPAFDVQLDPGDTWQDAVDANPPGTTFLVKAGTHSGQTTKPKTGDRFIGENGAIMDGGGTGVNNYALYAFTADNVDDVLIRNLTIVDHGASNNPAHGAVYGAQSAGWVVEGCRISGAIVGIGLGDRGVARHNTVHDCERAGIKGAGGAEADCLIEYNSIYNIDLADLHDPTNDAGGVKTGGDGTICRYNTIVDCHTHGIWYDVDAINGQIYRNTIINCEGNGVFFEISYDSVIHRNTITNCAHGSWLAGGFSSRQGGIRLSASTNVEVYENVISGCQDGIGGVEGDRGSGLYGERLLEDCYVHDNMIDGVTDIAGGINPSNHPTHDPTDPASNNVWEANIYTNCANTTDPFKWGSNNWTWAQWQSSGQDTGGSFNGS